MYRLKIMLVLFAIFFGATMNSTGQKAMAADQRELEKGFEKLLSGATLIGRFTVTGREENVGPRPEKYIIQKVTKLKGDKWLFLAGIQYADKKEVVVPLTLDVKWAGDTPVITLTNLAIPLIGTYSSRVMFYGDRYAGIWSGADHGGHLFGKIIRTKKEKSKEEPDGKESPAP